MRLNKPKRHTPGKQNIFATDKTCKAVFWMRSHLHKTKTEENNQFTSTLKLNKLMATINFVLTLIKPTRTLMQSSMMSSLENTVWKSAKFHPSNNTRGTETKAKIKVEKCSSCQLDKQSTLAADKSFKAIFWPTLGLNELPSSSWHN